MKHLLWPFWAAIALTAACKGDRPPASSADTGGATATAAITNAASADTQAAGDDADGAALSAPDVATDVGAADRAPAAVQLLEPGEEPRQALRYDLVAKTEQTVGLRMAISLELGATGQRMPTALPKTRMAVAAEVRSVGPNGEAEVALSVTEADLVEGEVAGATRASERLVGVIRSLRGLSGEKVVDAHGHTRSFALAPAEAVEDPPAVAISKPVLQGFVRAIDHMTVPLPSEPVGVGARWEVVDQVLEAGMELSQKRTFEVLAREGSALSLGFSVTLTPPPGDLEIESVGGTRARVESLAGTGEGKLEIDLARPLPSKLDGENKIDMKVAFDSGGAARTLDVTMGLELEVGAVTPPSGEVAIPLRSFQGRPVVDVRVDGKGPFAFLLDTGSPVTAIDNALVRELGLEISGQKTLRNPANGEEIPTDVVAVAAVEVGATKVERPECVAVDLGSLLRSVGSPRGILSSAVFSGRLLTLDFQKQRVILREGALPEPNGEDVFGYDEELPEIQVKFGAKAVRVHVDTGAPPGVRLPLAYTEQIPLVAPPIEFGTARLIGTEVKIMLATAREAMQVGPIRYESPSVRFFGDGEVGDIGFDEGSAFTVTIDHENRRVRVEPTGMEPEEPRTKRYGMRFRGGLDGDELEVVGVDKGSPAERAGLKAGDVIVRLNGSPLASFDTQARIQALRESPLEVAVRREGEVVELTLSLD